MVDLHLFLRIGHQVLAPLDEALIEALPGCRKVERVRCQINLLWVEIIRIILVTILKVAGRCLQTVGNDCHHIVQSGKAHLGQVTMLGISCCCCNQVRQQEALGLQRLTSKPCLGRQVKLHVHFSSGMPVVPNACTP